MSRTLGLVSILLLALAAGCGGSSGSTANLRPPGSPDIVLFSISGHDGVPSAPNCDFSSNRPYLADNDQAVEALVDLFIDLGFNGVVEHYTSRLEGVDADMDGTVDPDKRGLLDLLDRMQEVFDVWIRDFDNPTVIIIVAHDHGVVWAHAAARIKDQIPIAYLISLDGICEGWDCVHEAAIDAYQQANGDPFPFDLSVPCAAWTVTGETEMLDTSDVVFDNVTINLEVQSEDAGLRDQVNNRRLDGTQTGILRFLAVGETHNEVRQSTSDAMTWVTDTIRAIED